MKHITYGDKTIFAGDEAADTLLEYAALLGATGGADTVKMQCIGSDGNTVLVTFLLNAGASLVSESTNSELIEPEADEAVSYMKERIALITDPSPVQPVSRSEIDFEMPDQLREL